MRTINVAGRGFAWRERGQGEPVLFVHAFPLHGGMWEPQLEPLPSGWRGIAPDLRGFGGSGPAPDRDATLSMDTFAEDLTGFMDALSIERAVVCGLSMGGYAAFALWRRHRGRIRALVLADTRTGADTAEQRAGRAELAGKVLGDGASAAADALLPKLVAPATLEERPGLLHRIRAMIEAAPPASIAAALRGLAARPDSTALLSGIDVPALVLVGEQDAITPPAEAERMAAAIPGARLQVIPGAGHISNLERSDAFNDALTGFLAELP